MSGKLLPCPFCGGEAELIVGATMFRIECMDDAYCPCFQTKGHQRVEVVVKRWNTRTTRTQPTVITNPPKSHTPQEWLTPPPDADAAPEQRGVNTKTQKTKGEAGK